MEGDAPPPLREMAASPRADQTLFSRSRADALPEFGTYRIRVGLTSSTACRFCGLIPEGYPPIMPTYSPPVRSVPEPSPSSSAASPPSVVSSTALLHTSAASPLPAVMAPEPRPLRPQPAPSPAGPHPSTTVPGTTRPGLGSPQGPEHAPGDTTAPAHRNADPVPPFDPLSAPASFSCEYGASFDKSRSRATHRNACATW